jgi:hypothetical protein
MLSLSYKNEATQETQKIYKKTKDILGLAWHIRFEYLCVC